MPAPASKTKRDGLAWAKRFIDDEGRLQYGAVGVALGASVVVWGLGFVLLWSLGASLFEWNGFWALAADGFFGLLVPLPGSTTAVFVAIRGHVVAIVLGVLGVALGCTAGAALFHALGDSGRRFLQRRADRRRLARWTLTWSRRLAKRWTYLGVFLLLVPPFLVPRGVVILAASLVHLRPRPYLAVVFAGTLVREGLYALLIFGAIHLWNPFG